MLERGIFFLGVRADDDINLEKGIENEDIGPVEICLAERIEFSDLSLLVTIARNLLACAIPVP